MSRKAKPPASKPPKMTLADPTAQATQKRLKAKYEREQGEIEAKTHWRELAQRVDALPAIEREALRRKQLDRDLADLAKEISGVLFWGQTDLHTYAGEVRNRASDLRARDASLPALPAVTGEPKTDILVVRDWAAAPPNKQDAGYTVRWLCDQLGISSDTLNRYAKMAGVPTPPRGKRNHRFTLPQAVQIVKHIVDNSSESRVLVKAKALVDNLK